MSAVVDIIIPSYNHISFIDKCVNSILIQNFQFFNIIIIDDGSTDGSGNYITNKYGDHEKITVITQENKGLCKTLNRAIFEFCSSKYVIIIASDDQFLPHRLQNQIAFMEITGYELSYANSKIIDNNGNDLGIDGVKDKLSGELFEKLFLGEYNIPACTCIYTLKILIELGGFSEGALVEDSDMYLKVSSKYPIGYLDEYVSLYRRHSSNMSKTMTLEIYKDAKKRIEKYKLHPLYKKARKRVGLPTILNLAKENKRIDALKIAFRERPNITNRLFLIFLYYFIGLNFFYDPYKNH